MLSKNNFLILSSVILVLAIAGIYAYAPKEKIQPADEQTEIRSLVQAFGEKMKNISLLAPKEEVKASLEGNYGTMVSSRLIDRWAENPNTAPGRLTSSPWPERIEVASITKKDSKTYEVRGNVIEITSEELINGGISNQYPVTLTFEKQSDNSWLMVEYQKGDYASRETLEGEYVCLPHKDLNGPQTDECAIGIKTDDGKYYSLDFSLLSSMPPNFKTGDKIRVTGMITPIEQLSTNFWQKYNVQGIFSVTDSVQAL